MSIYHLLHWRSPSTIRWSWKHRQFVRGHVSYSRFYGVGVSHRFVTEKLVTFTCWFSAHVFNIHSFRHRIEGDGCPSRMMSYHCRYCGKEFTL